MCAPLTIRCQQRKHTLTLSDAYLVPCADPGSEACKAGEGAPNQTWQISNTDCVARRLPKDEYSQTMCQENLEKYGKSLWEMNKAIEDKKNAKKGVCVLQ